MCAFHSRAFLVARSIYAARAAMAGRPMPPMPLPPGPICEDLQRLLGDGPAPPAGAVTPAPPAGGGRLAGLFAAATAAPASGRTDPPARPEPGAPAPTPPA